jgi:hypothetical protein
MKHGNEAALSVQKVRRRRMYFSRMRSGKCGNKMNITVNVALEVACLRNSAPTAKIFFEIELTFFTFLHIVCHVRQFFLYLVAEEQAAQLLYRQQLKHQHNKTKE